MTADALKALYIKQIKWIAGIGIDKTIQGLKIIMSDGTATSDKIALSGFCDREFTFPPTFSCRQI